MHFLPSVEQINSVFDSQVEKHRIHYILSFHIQLALNNVFSNVLTSLPSGFIRYSLAQTTMSEKNKKLIDNLCFFNTNKKTMFIVFRIQIVIEEV